jgi:hypothetical protein
LAALTGRSPSGSPHAAQAARSSPGGSAATGTSSQQLQEAAEQALGGFLEALFDFLDKASNADMEALVAIIKGEKRSAAAGMYCTVPLDSTTLCSHRHACFCIKLALPHNVEVSQLVRHQCPNCS